MKTAQWVNTLVVICLFCAVVPWILSPARADPGAGYWNFSPYTVADLSTTNATGQAAIPDNQSILPGDPLYNLKLSFEQLDLSFTPNATVRIEKSMHYTENRLVEADIALRENRTDAESGALAQYSRDLDTTLRLIATIRNSTSTHLHVHTILARHLAVLNRTIIRHPRSADLLEAYNRTAAFVTNYQERNSTLTQHALPEPTRRPITENRSVLP